MAQWHVRSRRTYLLGDERMLLRQHRSQLSHLGEAIGFIGDLDMHEERAEANARAPRRAELQAAEARPKGTEDNGLEGNLNLTIEYGHP